MTPNFPDNIRKSSPKSDGFFNCLFCQKRLFTALGLKLHQGREHNSESSTEREEQYKVKTRPVRQCNIKKEQNTQSKDDDEICPEEEETEVKETSTKRKRKKRLIIEHNQFPVTSQQIKRVNPNLCQTCGKSFTCR